MLFLDNRLSHAKNKFMGTSWSWQNYFRFYLYPDMQFQIYIYIYIYIYIDLYVSHSLHSFFNHTVKLTWSFPRKFKQTINQVVLWHKQVWQLVNGMLNLIKCYISLLVLMFAIAESGIIASALKKERNKINYFGHEIHVHPSLLAYRA